MVHACSRFDDFSCVGTYLFSIRVSVRRAIFFVNAAVNFLFRIVAGPISAVFFVKVGIF
jgi:hypothetical protein